MENEKRLMFLASEVTIAEEDKLDPVFLSIKLKLADNVGNRNNEGITAAFISDLIKRQDEFNCLPFYADVKNLLARNYDKLGHMYNKVTKKFGTQQIGSLTGFYSETDNDGVISLYATARVPKRESETCIRLVELYELGKLCVSFEVRYNPEYTIEKDGIMFIDANEDNAMTGIAVVSVPACVDAVALDMVAEVADDSEDIVAECEEQTGERGETEKMPKNENVVAEVDETVVTEEINPQSEANVAAAEDTGASVADEQKESTAEVLEHSVVTEESVENYGGQPIHIIEYHERVIETMEDAGALIAELDNTIAELMEIKSKYDAIVAEQEAQALAEKQANARAFAEKQGLNVEDTAVAEAVEKLDYAKIAELSMAEERTEEKQDEPKESVSVTVFAEMEVDGNDKYGGLLRRRSQTT